MLQGGKGEFIILIYVEIRKPRRERGNVSLLWIQLGMPFNKNADLRSAVHCAFALREFSKNKEVYGYIFLANPFTLSDCDFLLWRYFKRRGFGTRLAKLHNLKLRFSEETLAVSPVIST
jgi:hypothetical protein